ncbi:hypothetical protein PSPO01_16316 [Paraphaeosphaeria sporulosa]
MAFIKRKLRSQSQTLVILPHASEVVVRFEVRSALQIDEGDFETPGAGIAGTFAPADDLKTLKQLKKDDKSEFQIVLLCGSGNALAEGRFIGNSQSSSQSVHASKAQQFQLATVWRHTRVSSAI